VKKVPTLILLVVLSLAASVPPVAHAKADSANRTAQKNAKKLAKQNARQLKRDRRMSQKATKNWKKHHQSNF